MRISINPVLFSHGRGGLEGVRPSSSREHQILAKVQISTSAPTASRRNRNFPFRYRPPPSAKRSGGRQALQLPRASNSCGSSNIHLHPDRVPQKSEFLVSVPSLLHPRRGLEGVRPSSSLYHHSFSEVLHPASAPTASRRNRKLLIGPCSSLAKRSGGRPALQLPRVSNSRGSSAFRPHPDRTLRKSEQCACGRLVKEEKASYTYA